MTHKDTSIKKNQKGMTLIETIVAVAIIGVVSLVFLGGLAVSSKGTLTIDEQATAESVARCQMEWVQGLRYVDDTTQYSPADLNDINDYEGYSANITAQPLSSPEDGIQKITITVLHHGDAVMSIEGYKRR